MKKYILLRVILIPEKVVSERSKQNPKLTELISEFEGNIRRFAPELWPEKSFNKLIRHYENLGLINSALEVAQMAIKNFKTRIDFYIDQARLLMKQFRYDEAQDSINKASHFSSPHDIQIPLMNARLLAAQKKEAEALSLIKGLKCKFHKTELLEIYLVEAFIYESMKDFEKMFYTLKEVLTSNPNNSHALQQIWVSVEFSKKYQESADLHLQIIDKNPYSCLAWYNLGHAYSCLGEYDKALEALEYSFLIDPRFEQGYMDCAELSLQIGQYEKAYQCYKEANEHFGPDTELVAYMAECLIKLKRFDEAKELLKNSVQQDPYNDEVFYYLAECYAQEGQWKKALRNYLEAIEIDSYREEFHLGAAVCYEKLGILKKAEVHYHKAARHGQEQSHYWFRFIQFLLNQQNLEKAGRILEKADKYSVGDDLTCCKIAYLLKSKMQDEATQLIEELLQESPEAIKFLFELEPELESDSKINAMVRYFSYSE